MASSYHSFKLFKPVSKGKRGEGYFFDEQIHIFCMGKFARLLVEMEVDYKYEVSCLNLVGYKILKKIVVVWEFYGNCWEQ